MNLDNELQESICEKLCDFSKKYGSGGYAIKTNYKNPDITFDEVKNCIIKYDNPDDISKLIYKYVENFDKNFYKFSLIDTDYVNLNDFAGFPILLHPIITDGNKVEKLVKYISEQVDDRIQKIVVKRVKKLSQYHNISKNMDMPYILIIVNDIIDIDFNEQLIDSIKKIVLKSDIVGIKFIFFTKQRFRSNFLGLLDSYFSYYNNCDFDSIYFNKSVNINSNQKYNVDYMNGLDFENFTKYLLENNGFKDVEVTPASGDYGVDVIAYKDDIKYAIQCKKYNSPVGIQAVQEVIGSKSIYDCDIAVVLTNNYFTDNAIKLAKKNRVFLWDKNKLDELMNNIN